MSLKKTMLHSMTAARLQTRFINGTNSLRNISDKQPSPLPLLPDIPTLPMLYGGIISKTLYSFSTVYEITNPNPNGPKTIVNWYDYGKLYRPLLIFGPQDVRGLVILAHGHIGPGYYATAYKQALDSIGTLLATNKFVCVSIAPRPTPPNGSDYAVGTIDTYIRHIKHIGGSFGDGLYLKGKPLIIVGHSQAGHAAVTAGYRIKVENPGGYAKLDALISVAGTTAASDLTDTEPCDEFLGIRGTHDGDNVAIRPDTISQYERLMRINRRYFLWLWFCNHRNFLDLDGLGPQLYDTHTPTSKHGVVSPVAQRTACANYVTMYLLWKFAGKTEFATPFLGEARVNFTSPNLDVQQSFNRLKTFPRFDRYRPRALGPLPASANFIDMFQDGFPISDQNPARYEHLEELDATCTSQATYGFVVSWDRTDVDNKSFAPRIEIAFDANAAASNIYAVEFHAIIIGDPDLPDDTSSPVNCELSIYYGANTQSDLVTVNIEPSLNGVGIGGLGVRTFSIPSTIRIPIMKFGVPASQFTNIKKLVIDFSRSWRLSCKIAITGFRVAFG